jgi:myo-inositol-1(or 4)-monophosphatase
VDEALERDLTAELESPERGIRIIGEETVGSRSEAYVQQALAGCTYVIDPIDGTAPFAHGIGYWGVSIGYMVGGRLCHGGIAIPAQNELFVTDGDRVLWDGQFDFMAGGEPDLQELTPRLAPWNPGALVALGQRQVRNHSFPWPNPSFVSGCAINVLAYLMVGRVSAYVGHMKLWDLAAVLPMLLRCGVEARLIDGTPLGAAVDAAAYDLTPGSAKRWALRDDFVCGVPGVFDGLYPELRAHMRGSQP